MARCRSWRPVAVPGHPAGHLPGRCRRCWRPCGNPVDGAGNRCDECLWLLAAHRDPRIRLALIDEDPPRDVLDLMATDLDSVVQRAAEAKVRQRQEKTERREGIPW